MDSREQGILHTYESQPRQLSPEYLSKIRWDDVKNHPLDPKFIRVLLYFRDIEAFTQVYHQELCRTPTGRDPLIRKFMDRWMTEEAQHAELLNRFLNESGHETKQTWFSEAKQNISLSYKVKSRIQPYITNLFGKHFTAVHMTWGTIQELSTLQGYRRIWEQANHPVLEYIMRGIAAEEAIHILFYRAIARLKLEQSRFSQQLARYLVEHFWQPVGQGAKSAEDTNYVISTLFAGPVGLEAADQRINLPISQLPGFEQFTFVKNRIAEIALQVSKQLNF